MSRNNRNVTNNAKVKNNSTINNIKTRLNIMNSIKEKFGFSVMSNNKNNSNNNTNKGFMTKFEGNKTYLIIAAILLLIILIVAGIFIYRYMKSKRKVYVVTKNYIPYIHDAFIEKVIPYGSLPASSEGNEYNINVWLYINEYENMQQYPKPIIYIGNPDNLTNDDPTNHSSSNPSIWLRKGENTLRVVVGLDTEYGKGCSLTKQCSSKKADNCDVEHVPLQRWINVNISLRNSVLDIFIDGQLHKSCILSGAPTLNKGDLHICKGDSTSAGGFNGYISKLRYSNKALSSTAIKDFYEEGPVVEHSSKFFDLLNVFNLFK